MTKTETFYGDKITERETIMFDRVKQEHTCLVRCTLNGVQRAAICEAYEDEDGGVVLFPIALLMTDDEVREAIDPTGQPTQFMMGELVEEPQDSDHVVS